MRQVIQKASRDGILPTFKSAINRLDQPITLGYSSAGIVEEIAPDVSQFKPGDRVVCAGGGYAVHGGYGLVPVNLASPLPEAVDFSPGRLPQSAQSVLTGFAWQMLRWEKNRQLSVWVSLAF